MKLTQEHIQMNHEGPKHKHHMPPHLRKNMIQIEFDEEDRAILREIEGDEDSVEALIKIIQDAPPEMKILTTQILKMIKEVA